ncbi:MAG: tyrosine-type recombinase/integrase [Blastocatellia bacterium]
MTTANPDEQLALLTGGSRALTRAIELWALGTTRPETWEREYRLQDKRAAVSRFFAFVRKHPEEVTPGDVEHWRKHLEGRGQKPATVYARVSRLSSFYEWLLSNPKLAAQIGSNPVSLARPRYPRPYQSDSASAWTDQQTKAILGVVKELAETGSIIGMRDHALLMFYIYSGLRRNEVISLRGRDLEFRDDTLIIKYRRKGGKYSARELAVPEAHEALLTYLEASGRKGVLKSAGAIWIRHDRAGKGSPLGSRAFANNLKKYASAAGLNEVHIHQTRHTYARMVSESTGSFLETQEALDHENLATTKVYVQRISVKPDKHGRNIADRLNKVGR